MCGMKPKWNTARRLFALPSATKVLCSIEPLNITVGVVAHSRPCVSPVAHSHCAVAHSHEDLLRVQVRQLRLVDNLERQRDLRAMVLADYRLAGQVVAGWLCALVDCARTQSGNRSVASRAGSVRSMRSRRSAPATRHQKQLRRGKRHSQTSGALVHTRTPLTQEEEKKQAGEPAHSLPVVGESAGSTGHIDTSVATAAVGASKELQFAREELEKRATSAALLPLMVEDAPQLCLALVSAMVCCVVHCIAVCFGNGLARMTTLCLCAALPHPWR